MQLMYEEAVDRRYKIFYNVCGLHFRTFLLDCYEILV
jgi:hypothetical protein